MGLFGKILGKLGIGGAETIKPKPITAKEILAQRAKPGQPMAAIDVMAILEQRAATNPQKLNWRTSIVDLLKLLEIDSSFTARQELATELGCPPEKMVRSEDMNIWLHREVLAQIAANGGNIPQEMLS